MILLSNQTYRQTSPVGRFIPPALVAVVLALVLWSVDWGYVTQLDFSVLPEYRKPILDGLLLTLFITFLSLLIGTVAGAVFAVLLHVAPKPVRFLIHVYVEIWRNVPLIVQVFWVHFSLPILTGISTSALTSGCIAISLQAAAYLTDIARGGIRAVARGQFEAADSIGLSAYNKWALIIIPQAAKLMVGPLLNVTLSFFKATTILGVLSIPELLSAGVRVSEFTFKPIEVLTVIALIYLVAGLGITTAARRIERRF